MKIKKTFAIILTFILCFSVLTIAFADETAEVPEGYTPIYTAEDLNNIRNDLDKKYILMNDIDLSVYKNWEPIGSSEAPFTGELNGNGYFIRNMMIISECADTENNLGFFGVVSDGSLQKVILENGSIFASHIVETANIEKSISAGMLAGKVTGENYMKTVSCSSTGTIDINGFSNVSVGGLIGTALKDNYIGSSSNYVNIDITTQNNKQKIYIGGILGKPSDDIDSYYESFFNIKNCANHGNISINNNICSEDTRLYAGGITSYQITGNKLFESYNRGKISSQNSTGLLVIGGIISEAIARVEKCYNAGDIIIPADDNDKVSAVCNIKTPYLYAPEGPAMAQDYIVYDCYCLNDGLTPCYQDSDIPYEWYDNVFVLSDTEMKERNYFTSFNFDTVWAMEENGYPVLQNQPIINIYEAINLEVKETFPVKVNNNIRSITSNEVAIINEKGEITAISAGSTTIIIFLDYGYSYTYNVTVTKTEEATNPDNETPTQSTTNSSTNKPCFENLWIVKTIKLILNKIYLVICHIVDLTV